MRLGSISTMDTNLHKAPFGDRSDGQIIYFGVEIPIAPLRGIEVRVSIGFWVTQAMTRIFLYKFNLKSCINHPKHIK